MQSVHGVARVGHDWATELNWILLSSVRFSSVGQSCLTFCNLMVCSTPGFPFHHQSLVFPLINTPVLELAAATAKLLQSCLTVWYPIDGSPPGSPVPRILQARTLEWVAISFSNAWKWKVKVKSLSHVWLLATPWTGAYQAPPSLDFPSKSTRVGGHCLNLGPMLIQHYSTLLHL